MESIFVSTQRLIDDLQERLFPRLESNILTKDDNNWLMIETECYDKLRQIDANCDRFEIFVNKEIPSKRVQSKMRLDQLRYDRKHLESALSNLKHRRNEKQREESERNELLTRRFTSNTETNIAMDYYVDEHSKLKGFHSNVDDMINHGANVLGSLKDQRGMLKGAHRKLIDIGNTLGLSNTIMRLIEKRAYGDKYILFGGMIILCILMFLIWKYFT